MSRARHVKDVLSWIHRVTSPLRAHRADASEVFIFCYHRINATRPAPLGIDLDVFVAQLELFASCGALLSPEDFFAFLRGEAKLPATKNFLVTFDDGYVSSVERAFPALQAARARAISFVATGRLGRHIPGPAGLESPSAERTVTPDEIKATGSAFLYQSHGHDHIDYSGGSRTTVLADLSSSLDWFKSELGYRPRALAYPFGQAPRWPGWEEDLRKTGIEAGFVTGSHPLAVSGGAPGDSQLRLPRVGYLTDETLAHTRARLTGGLTLLRALDSPRWRR